MDNPLPTLTDEMLEAALGRVRANRWRASRGLAGTRAARRLRRSRGEVLASHARIWARKCRAIDYALELAAEENARRAT